MEWFRMPLFDSINMAAAINYAKDSLLNDTSPTNLNGWMDRAFPHKICLPPDQW